MRNTAENNRKHQKANREKKKAEGFINATFWIHQEELTKIMTHGESTQKALDTVFKAGLDKLSSGTTDTQSEVLNQIKAIIEKYRSEQKPTSSRWDKANKLLDELEKVLTAV